jgi:hypothetical protein
MDKFCNIADFHRSVSASFFPEGKSAEGHSGHCKELLYLTFYFPACGDRSSLFSYIQALF